MSYWKELNTRAQRNTKRLQESETDTMKAFQGLQESVFKDGALDEKTKEFVALAYAIADKCEGCIGNHVNKLIKFGVTREEIADLASVAIVMGGGPGSVYGGKAIEAYDEAVSSN